MEFIPSQSPIPVKRSASGGDDKASPKPNVEAKSDMQQGLDFLAQWIERVTSRVRVKISDVEICFRNGDSLLTLVIGSASYYDESNSGTVQKRGLVLTGVRVQMTMPDQSSCCWFLFVLFYLSLLFARINYEQRKNKCTGLAKFSTEVATTAQLVLNKRKHRPAEVPLVESECFVHWLDIRLCPDSISALQDLVQAFDSRPSGASSPRLASSSLHTPPDEFEKSLTAADLQRFKELLPWYDDDDSDNMSDSNHSLESSEFFDALEEDPSASSKKTPRQRFFFFF